MPYISKEERIILDGELERLLPEVVNYTPGHLAYALTRILHTWIGNERSYSILAQAYGVLQTVATEFYRKVIAPYEDEKAAQNGDVLLTIH